MRPTGRLPPWRVSFHNCQNRRHHTAWPVACGTSGTKKVACVLLNDGGTPVTMAVADAGQVKSPKSSTMERNGITYHVETVGELQMVMTERQSRWICFIGAVYIEKLNELAEAIKF